MSAEPHTDDRRLVRRMLGGEEAAFRELFDRTFPGLYRFALSRLSGDADLAEEIVQAALCRAVTKLHTYRGEAALFTWLCTFCRYEISGLMRRPAQRAVAVELVEDVPEIRAALESLPALGAELPAEGLLRRELGELVQRTLDLLPTHYGDALEWKYVDGLSVREIAARLGVGPKAAESLLTRARQAFRDAFGGTYRAWSGGEIGASSR